METNLVIKQSHLGTRTRFEFGPDKLTETIADGLGERTFTMPYLNICTEDVERIALKSRRPTAYLWAAAAPLVFAGMRAGYDVPVFGAIVGALGFGLFFLGILADHFQWFRTVIDLMPVVGNSQNVRVIRNKDYDRIMGLIRQRRRDALRVLFERVDEISDFEARKSRLDYLLKCDAISDEEYAHAIEVATIEPPIRQAMN